MIFRQLFDETSYTYTYLLADEQTKEALIIDSVEGKVDDYIRLLKELGLTLKATLDTHTHADHITAASILRDRTACQSLVGKQSKADCASAKFQHGDLLSLGRHSLKVLYTPGHTDDSYSFLLDGPEPKLFSGDTLLIRGTGRTDFQNGSAAQQYRSLVDILLALPAHTLVYPGHDYKGASVSTIGEERQHNPRLKVASEQDYVELMTALNLPNPTLMDIAVPANQACGKHKPLA